MRKIRITDPAGRVLDFPFELVEGSAVSIGKSEDCSIHLVGDPFASRVHCYVHCAAGRIYITDNNSTNGLYRNDERVSAELMQEGVSYRAGASYIVLMEAEPAPEPAFVPPPLPEAEPASEPAFVPPPLPESELTPEPAFVPPPLPEAEPTPEPAFVPPPLPEAEPTPEPAFVPPPLPEAEPAPEPAFVPPPLPEAEPTPEPAFVPPPLLEAEPASEPAFVPPPLPEAEPAPEPAFVPPSLPQADSIPSTKPVPSAAPVRKSKPVTNPGPRALRRAVDPGSVAPKRVALPEVKEERRKLAPPPQAEKSKVSLTVYETRKVHMATGAVNTGDSELPADFELFFRLDSVLISDSGECSLRFGARAEVDCSLFLVQHDVDGRCTLLLPESPETPNRLYAGGDALFPPLSDKCDYEYEVAPPFGEEVVVAVACTQPVPLPGALADQLKRGACPPVKGELELIEALRRKNPEARWAVACLRFDTRTVRERGV